jgi:hypothetical protein
MKQRKRIHNILFVLSLLVGLNLITAGSNIVSLSTYVISTIGNRGQNSDISSEMEEMKFRWRPHYDG